MVASEPREVVAPRDRRYIPTFDGWRAVAITVVMLQHSSDQITAAVGSWIEPGTNLFRENGRLGVAIFFAISGYLITSLLLDEFDRSGSASLRAFYVKRAFRILPPLLVVLATFGVLGLTGVIPIPLGKWLGSLLFVQNYTPGGSWYLGHFWSLAVEEQFYVIWPILLVVCRPRRALRVCAGLIVAVALWRFVDLHNGITASSPLHFDDRTDTQLDGLLWGCLLAMTCRAPAVRDIVGRVTRGWRWWVLLAALVASQAAQADSAWGESAQRAVRPLLIGLIVVGTALAPATPIGRVLELPALRWVGRISYSLYLWQQLFLTWDGFEARRLEWVQWFPLSVAAAFTMAYLSHRFVERPTTAYGRRLAGRVRTEPRAEAHLRSR